MKNLIIIGAGGYGKQLYYSATNCIGYNEDFKIKGFLDYLNSDWDNSVYPPILGLEDEYNIEKDDVFCFALGDVKLKKRICEKIKSKGGEFYTLIHNTAIVPPMAIIGKGCYIGARCMIGVNAVIGDYCMIQAGASVGHDARVGEFTRIDSNCFIVGGVEVGKEVNIHTNAVINHKVSIGDCATIGALSFVIRNVKPNTTVFGIPAKKI